MNANLNKLKSATIRPILFLFLAIAALSLPIRAEAEDQAESYLIEQVKRNQLYQNMKCVMFMSEGRDGDKLLFVTREKHEGDCPGEPDVSPVLDRFQVDLQQREIRRYDPLEDEYRPYLKSHPEGRSPN